MVKTAAMLRPVVCALAIFAAATVVAQSSVGLRAGTTFSKGVYDDDDLDEVSYLTAGYLVGVPAEFILTENFGVQAEVNLLQRGQRTEIEFDFFGAQIRDETITRLTYLDFAGLAKAGLLDDELTVAAVAGPSLSYALGGRNVDEEGDTEKIDWDDEGNTLRRLDFGFAFGAQAGMAIGPGRVVLDARYRFGLNDLTDDGDGAAVTLHSRAFSGSLGYLLPLEF